MTIDFSPVMSLGALMVSAVVGGVTTWLALGKRREEAGLARATRRTSALQLLTDEEFTLTKELLAGVRERRREIEPRIQALSAVEIEVVIASAYHGKRLAEAQLERTLRSKNEILKEYGLFDRAASASPD